MFGRFLLALAAFTGFAILAYVGVFFGGLLILEMLGAHGNEGESAMTMAFLVAPLFALVGGIAGSIWVMGRKSR